MPHLGSPVTQADMAALGLSAHSTHWLNSADYFSPGPLNALRRAMHHPYDSVTNPNGKQRIDPADAANGLTGGNRGWPGAVVSGPWVLPPAAVGRHHEYGIIPGIEDPWVGLMTTKKGIYPEFSAVRVVASGPISHLQGRADVGSNTTDGQGWSGTYHPYSVGEPWTGWLDLTFECAITPAAAEVGPYPGNDDALIWIDLAFGGEGAAVVTAVVNGVSATVTGVDSGFPGGTLYRYTVYPGGAYSGGTLKVAFTWAWDGDPPFPPAPSGWGTEFSVYYNYGSGGAYAPVLAASGYSAVASPDLGVVAAGGGQVGYSIGTVYVWPEFYAGETMLDATIWCFIAKTFPITAARYSYGVGLFPGSMSELATGESGGFLSLPFSAPMARAQDGDPGTPASTGPHWELELFGPPTALHQPTWSLRGFWMARRGLCYDHEPFLPGVPKVDTGRPELGPAVEVKVGVWRGGAFVALATHTLAPTTAYEYVPFDLPWPVQDNMAVLYQSKVAGEVSDIVTVTVPALNAISLPTGYGFGSVLDDWDVSWIGALEAGVNRGGTGALEYPTTGNNPATPWVDYPPCARNEAPPLAWHTDTAAMLAVAPP